MSWLASTASAHFPPYGTRPRSDGKSCLGRPRTPSPNLRQISVPMLTESKRGTRVAPAQVHVIAEAGTNHGGSLDVACRLVDVAVQGAADSIKFQLIHPETLYLPKTYEDGRYTGNEVFQRRLRGMLREDEYYRLSRYAAERGIAVTASVFDE